ncbi:hypothetical protein FB45DRAFT_125138 [Roridomyces roridus]|uniref:SMP-30/Gluconolactonase/LRE-like region domain-containing protein n=1 Tax=Roridomyces roridus TaxID=1738132 RepID=A0AAD7BJD6_9AGAR|nr:hypothetical protein FB45DRAFT_125138 [Roridomyces roridus]
MKLIALLALPLLSLSVGALYNATVVYQSPDPLHLLFEDLVARASGHLLLTACNSSTLHSFDPSRSETGLTPIHTFPNCDGLMGIVEIEPDVFAVASGFIDLIAKRGANMTVWTVDLNPSHSAPLVRKVAVVPNCSILDGFSTIPGSPHLILSADPGMGVVWQINLVTGASRIAFDDPSMSVDGPPPALGVNGIHVRDGFLYYSNSDATTFSRIPVQLNANEDMVRAGNAAAQLMSTAQPAGFDHEYDGFDFDEEGRVWAATHTGAVTLITQRGEGSFEAEIVAGSLVGPSIIEEPSSAQFGRGSAEQAATLYVTTAAGQLLAVDTSAGAPGSTEKCHVKQPRCY